MSCHYLASAVSCPLLWRLSLAAPRHRLRTQEMIAQPRKLGLSVKAARTKCAPTILHTQAPRYFWFDGVGDEVASPAFLTDSDHASRCRALLCGAIARCRGFLNPAKRHKWAGIT